jgi:hypothetical protein
MYSLYKNEYRIFKPAENIIRRGLRKKEENGGYESILVIIHIYIYKYIYMNIYINIYIYKYI